MLDAKTKHSLKRGDPEAYKELFLVLYPRLKGYCSLFIHDEDEAEDIVQESFIALWENRKSIDTSRSVESFLFVVLRNRCLNALKAKKLEEGLTDIDNLQTDELQYLYQLDFTGREEKSLEEMLIDSFQQAVEELPSKMKKVFVLCKLEGKRQKDVAEELGISIKMVEKQVAKAKNQIRDKLLKEFPALTILILMLLK